MDYIIQKFIAIFFVHIVRFPNLVDDSANH